MKLFDGWPSFKEKELEEKLINAKLYIDNLQKQLDGLKEDNNRLHTKLAGCAVAANGGISGEQLAKPFSYGWSKSYQDVVDLRIKYERLLALTEDKLKISSSVRIFSER